MHNNRGPDVQNLLRYAYPAFFLRTRKTCPLTLVVKESEKPANDPSGGIQPSFESSARYPEVRRQLPHTCPVYNFTLPWAHCIL